MKKLVIFHPALMPYRVDFFRALRAHFDLSLYFTTSKNTNQELNQRILIDRLGFCPHYCLRGFKIGKRIVRVGIGKIIAREKPELVFAPEFTFITLTVLLARFLRRKRYKAYVVSDDNYSIASGNRTGIRRFIRWLVLKRIDGLILTNEEVKQWYQVRYPKLQYLVFPILQEDLLFRTRLEKSLPISSCFTEKFKLLGKKVFLYVGRFAEVKNIPFLLDAFAAYCATQADAILVMIGEGEQKNELMHLVMQKGLTSHICFAGHYEDNELLAWYNIGQVLILPSRYEPFGCVVNEALLAGVYVLASNEVGAKCLLSEEAGTIFSLQSIDELTCALKHFGNRLQPVALPLSLKRNLMKVSFLEEFEHLKVLA